MYKSTNTNLLMKRLLKFRDWLPREKKPLPIYMCSLTIKLFNTSIHFGHAREVLYILFMVTERKKNSISKVIEVAFSVTRLFLIIHLQLK